MSDRPSYPRRPPFFAQRFIRLLVKTCAMQQLGQDAFALLATIATTEDAKRYAGAVTFHNGQLLPVLGFAKWERLDNARRKAVAQGWLHYQPPAAGRHEPGVYWVEIPAGVAALPDSPIDEDGDVVRAAYLRGHADGKAGRPAKPYPGQGDSSEQPSPAAGYGEGDGGGYGEGDGGGEPSILSLCPLPKGESASPQSPNGDPSALKLDSLIERWNEIPGIVHCRQATSKRQTAFRVRARDPQWLAGIDDALSAVAASQFLQGDNDRNWRADIDWFLRPDSLTRILEGKYSSKSQVASLYADLDHQAAASNGRTA